MRTVYEESSEAAQVIMSRLQSKLPRSLDAAVVSPFAKVPYKAAVLNVGMTYRVVELAQATLEALHSLRTVAASISARAVVETAAVHDYVVRSIEKAVHDGSSFGADDVLMRSLTGQRFNSKGGVTPINVLTAIDHRNKEFPMFREMYDQLSEYAHPNWQGVHAPFAVENETEFTVQFDQHYAGGIRRSEVVLHLCIALAAFEDSQVRLEKCFANFVKVCVADVVRLDCPAQHT